MKPAVHGHVFKNVEEVRSAVIAFKDRYSRDWRLKKLASCHPAKPARLMPCEGRPELQNRVQTNLAGTRRFTTDIDVVVRMIASGWLYEGVKMCGGGN